MARVKGCVRPSDTNPEGRPVRHVRRRIAAAPLPPSDIRNPAQGETTATTDPASKRARSITFSSSPEAPQLTGTTAVLGNSGLAKLGSRWNRAVFSLRRYWIRFEGDDQGLPDGTALSCGVTAIDLHDAIELINRLLFDGMAAPISEIVEDVDVSTVDKGHVLLNLGDVTRRGIWFPAR